MGDNMKKKSNIGWWIAGAAALFLLKKKAAAVEGVGAAKRRIYKEISLAQQAGVDFTKKYDELTEDEIESLQRVSNETGFTETYYKGLKKAYDAISGIGEAYDIADENGNTVLTWIEDPEAQMAYEDPERYRALLEAREIEEDRIYSEQHKAQAFEEREKRLAEQRKRLAKAGRSSQMQLFGCGYAGDPTYTKNTLDKYLNTYDPLELVAEAVSENKILCSVGDNRGGRYFYLSSDNFMYLFNYCLMRNVPIALWNGARWITRNNGDELISGCGYAAAHEPYWYGIPSVQFIYHGEWADPEIYYKGRYYNAESVEEELYAIWREQIEYDETRYDFDEWMQKVGGEYLKTDVLPYM